MHRAHVAAAVVIATLLTSARATAQSASAPINICARAQQPVAGKLLDRKLGRSSATYRDLHRLCRVETHVDVATDAEHHLLLYVTLLTSDFIEFQDTPDVDAPRSAQSVVLHVPVGNVLAMTLQPSGIYRLLVSSRK